MTAESKLKLIVNQLNSLNTLARIEPVRDKAERLLEEYKDEMNARQIFLNNDITIRFISEYGLKIEELRKEYINGIYTSDRSATLGDEDDLTRGAM